MTDTATVTVNLTDVNEAPEIEDFSFELSGTTEGTEVGTVSATDPDANSTLTYSLTDGNPDPDGDGTPTFSIDPQTGIITIADSDDLSLATSSLNLGVTVSDGELETEATVEITFPNLLVFTTPGDDELEPELTPNAQITFTGAGADQIDAIIANSAAPDRFYAGSENDLILAGTNDRLFGELGNDILDASQGGGGNRLYGNEGNDELIAGTGDVLVGGLGNDTPEGNAGGGENYLFGNEGNDFFSLRQNDTVFGGGGDDTFALDTGGNNTIQGNEGADTFNIISGELPVGANTITDFSVQDGDIISIASTVDPELNEFADLTLTPEEGNTTISANIGGETQDLLILEGVDNLTADSFQFV